MKLNSLFALLVTQFSQLFFQNLEAQVYPADFSQVQVANGLANPTFISFSPDGRIFVSEQGGTLRIIKNGAGKAVIRFSNKGSENVLHISTGNLSKGVYQVEMTTSTHVYVEKLLIE